ncbi:MAG: hypothetical protein U0L18_08995 [Acutalibacteraceae bacterium]|nr:hypothetical protein [Acutalibacteraceae bacterium]
MNETFKKFGKRIAAIGVGITAVILGIIIRGRNSSYRKRAREIEGIVDAAEDCNRTALDGIEEAERILQKARKRKGKD